MSAQIEHLPAGLQRFVLVLKSVGIIGEVLPTSISHSSHMKPQSIWAKICKLVSFNNLQTNSNICAIGEKCPKHPIDCTEFLSLINSNDFLPIPCYRKVVASSRKPITAVEIRAPPVIGTIKAILNVADILLDTKLSM